MGVDKFMETYLERDREDGSYRDRQKPCPFLGDDDRCMICDVRPTTCREYPHTDKPGFTLRTIVFPVAFGIVEYMKRQALD